MIGTISRAATLFTANGAGYLPGDLLKRPRLADTLRAIAREGRDGFYRGSVARKIADAMAENGGLITLEDLAGYDFTLRQPVRGEFRGYIERGRRRRLFAGWRLLTFPVGFPCQKQHANGNPTGGLCLEGQLRG